MDENTINNVPDDKADDILCLTDDEERIAKLIHAIDRLTAEEKALITLFIMRTDQWKRLVRF